MEAGHQLAGACAGRRRAQQAASGRVRQPRRRARGRGHPQRRSAGRRPRSVPVRRAGVHAARRGGPARVAARLVGGRPGARRGRSAPPGDDLGRQLAGAGHAPLRPGARRGRRRHPRHRGHRRRRARRHGSPAHHGARRPVADAGGHPARPGVGRQGGAARAARRAAHGGRLAQRQQGALQLRRRSAGRLGGAGAGHRLHRPAPGARGHGLRGRRAAGGVRARPCARRGGGGRSDRRRRGDATHDQRRARHRAAAPLARDVELDKLALVHSEEMRRTKVVGHDVGGGDPRARIEAAGIKARIAGENVASASTLEGAHRALWSSPSHRGNLLGDRWTRVGVAVVRGTDGFVWVTELFAG
ncbi:MAG: CAP domain-containing protein [Polyangiaceae bacterium]